MISGPVYCPHMVGRRAQLDFLIERAKAAADGRGSLVFIEGDSGSGKTRLVTEWLAADREPMRHLEGRCYQYARAPFGPIIAGVRALFRDDAALVPTDRAARVILSRLIPELGDAPPMALPLDPSEKLHHFEVLADVLRRAAAKRPTLYVIEDLHWADEATAEFLEHFARGIGNAGLCIAATYRADELPRGHPLRGLVARLEREPACWRLGIEPLDDEEMQRFISEALGETEIAPDVALVVTRRSEGRPLFAEELLRAAIGARGTRAAAQLPGSLREAVLERLRQLGDADQSALKTASAVGRRFSAELLAAVTGLPLAEVIASLKRAIDVQLIEQGEDGTLEFRHELTREAVYSELLAAEARPLHATIARALEAQSDAPQRVTELAFQWWSAGDAAKAATYNEQAGDAADAVVASKDAATYYERALEALKSDDPKKAVVLRKLAGALYRAGLGAKAKSAYEQSAAAFVAAGDEEEAARTLVELARLQWTLGDMSGRLAATTRAIELIADREDSPALFAARVELAWTSAFHGGNAEEAMRLLEQAVPYQARAGAKDRIKFFECRSLVQLLRARTDEALQDEREAGQLALSIDDIATAVRCWGNVGMLAAQCGERRVAEAAFAQATELIDEERPFGWPTPWVLALHAYAQLLWGRLADAESTIERALSAILDVPSLDAIVAWVGLPLGVRRENAAMVRRCADAALIDFAFHSGSTLIGGVSSAFAEYYFAQGRRAEAVALLERAIDTLTADPPPGDWDAALQMGVEHADRPHAEHACAILTRIAETTEVRSAPAHATLARAAHQMRFGDKAAGAELAHKAAHAFAQLGWPAFQARALELAGEHVAARDLYVRMGDRHNGRRLDDLTAPVNKRGRRKNELSRREGEIAALILAGKSNKEIATDLTVSERTVESHVASIFAKLGVSSRRELTDRLKASRS
jgi:DNA-binding CsgD family transcriptional regulator